MLSVGIGNFLAEFELKRDQFYYLLRQHVRGFILIVKFRVWLDIGQLLPYGMWNDVDRLKLTKVKKTSVNLSYTMQLRHTTKHRTKYIKNILGQPVHTKELIYVQLHNWVWRHRFRARQPFREFCCCFSFSNWVWGISRIFFWPHPSILAKMKMTPNSVMKLHID